MYRRFSQMLVVLLATVAVLLTFQAAVTFAQAQAGEAAQGSDYTTVFYKSGDLNIEAYLYKPSGKGPFPLVIYNHGSRRNRERAEVPFRYVANMLVGQGYAVLVPERRGYGKSDGKTFTEAAGGDVGPGLIARMNEESDDVLASLDYLKSVSFVDLKRVTIMGWSHGGIVSVLAAGKRHAFVALIDQTGGALTWRRSPDLQRAMTASAKTAKVPTLCLAAENDATTDAAKSVCAAARAAGAEEKTIIYPPFTPTNNANSNAPGHMIFSAEGMPIWQNDLLSFLKTYAGKK